MFFVVFYFFFFKQKTAYEMRISDWSSDVCSSDLYARSAAAVFAPRERKDAPHLLVAEAGTGIGKTLGYLAPAKQWIDAAAGSICISTYTKALQRQISRETARLYPDPAEHREKVVVRKGREHQHYLLNPIGMTSCRERGWQ